MSEPTPIPMHARPSAGEAERLRRQADFYRALSDMSKAVVSMTDPQALYATICRIAVESGHALMAWIGIIEGDALVPVAWGGPARDYTEGLDIRCPAPDADPSTLGPTACAIWQGRTFVCNDFLNDPRTQRWSERAGHFGVKASAAFPIRRFDLVVGTLNLYFSEPNAFDEDTIELVEQMLGDLRFALDRLDREAADAMALRERELQFSAIVETAMEAIITLDVRGRIVLINRAACRMFGVTPEEVLGGGIDRFLPPEFVQAHRGHLQAFATTGTTSRSMGGMREIVGMRASGERFPLEASISRSGEGDRLLMTVVARDVTQLRQAEKSQLARTAAEASSRAKTEFLSRISHELRTPLNAMLGFAQLMQSDRADPLSSRHREHIELVLQAGTHLRTLIEEMLDVARIESGRMAMEVCDFELCELLDGALRMSEPHAAEKGVTLFADYRALGPVMLRNDPGRLRQVVLNLLSNAIKYNRGGGSVHIRAAREGMRVHVSVEDNGMGMSEQQKAGLFQPFNRLGRERSEVEGTGIGMVLVRQLVGLMEGELAVDSEADKGTSVRITLPALNGVLPTEPAPERLTLAADRPEPEGLVLYIEDNAINALLVEQMLARWKGVRLVIAPDGAGGLAEARSLQPDLLLLDMQLPDMNGTEVLRRLKSDPLTADIAVVALSASAVPQDVQAALDAGAIDYWTKPVDLERFLAGVQRLLKP